MSYAGVQQNTSVVLISRKQQPYEQILQQNKEKYESILRLYIYIVNVSQREALHMVRLHIYFFPLQNKHKKQK